MENTMRNNKKEPVNINNDSNQNVATDETISNLFFTNVSEEAEDNTTNVKSEDKTTDIKVETSIEDNGNYKVNASAEKVEENVVTLELFENKFAGIDDIFLHPTNVPEKSVTFGQVANNFSGISPLKLLQL